MTQEQYRARSLAVCAGGMILFCALYAAASWWSQRQFDRAMRDILTRPRRPVVPATVTPAGQSSSEEVTDRVPVPVPA